MKVITVSHILLKVHVGSTAFPQKKSREGKRPEERIYKQGRLKAMTSMSSLLVVINIFLFCT